MLPSIALLLTAYGITFGMMNKADFLAGKSAFTDRMLRCSYCTGFHAGWMTWLLSHVRVGWEMPVWALLVEAGIWAFASSVFCYGVDTVLQLAESWVRKTDD